MNATTDTHVAVGPRHECHGFIRVEVYAPRRTGRKVPPPLRNSAETIDEIIELIPPRYNTQSTLQREVKPGRNVLDFDLVTR